MLIDQQLMRTPFRHLCKGREIICDLICMHVDISAAGIDFIGTPAVLTFNGSTPLQCSQVDITNDEIVENNETFFVQLGSTGDLVNISLDSATVTITDDDCENWIVIIRH